LNPNYAADRVHFKDLFFMVPKLSSGVELETCFKGKTIKHKVSMDWKPEYGRGLQWIAEPNMMGVNNDYEMFGDVSVMQMTVNHVSMAISKLGNPGPARWLHPDLIATPRLVVNYVRSGSYAADILPLGAAVTKVNGHEVNTLQDFRDHFVPEGKVWTMETDMGKVVALMFDKSLKEQLQKADMMNAPYLLTPGVVQAAKKLGLTKKADEDKLGSPMHAKSAKKHAFLTSSAAVTTGQKLPMRAAGPLEAHKLEDGTNGRSTVSADGTVMMLTA